MKLPWLLMRTGGVFAKMSKFPFIKGRLISERNVDPTDARRIVTSKK